MGERLRLSHSLTVNTQRGGEGHEEGLTSVCLTALLSHWVTCSFLQDYEVKFRPASSSRRNSDFLCVFMETTIS